MVNLLKPVEKKNGKMFFFTINITKDECCTSSYLMSRSQVWHLKHPTFSTHGLVTSTGAGTNGRMFFNMGHGNHMVNLTKPQKIEQISREMLIVFFLLVLNREWMGMGVLLIVRQWIIPPKIPSVKRTSKFRRHGERPPFGDFDGSHYQAG